MKKRILIFLLIILFLAVIAINFESIRKLTGKSIDSYYEQEQAILIRVVDGDTIHALVNGEDWTIRLLGINSPEKKMPHANSAPNYLNPFINKTIILVRDKEDTDKYKRKLRYLFIGNTNIDIEILREGYANSYYTDGLIYEQELLNAEKYARQNQKGIWQKSLEKCAEENCIKLKELNEREEYFIILNQCSFYCNLEGWFAKDAGRNTFYLSSLKADEEKTYFSKQGSEVWNNDHDKFFIFDEKGLLVLYYEY
jgi:endonuclease YncB( thermonuclease family)